MALADYYGRSALAAAQALGGGFDQTRFRALLEATAVGVAFSVTAADASEGRRLLEMTVRLLARLYPRMQIDPGSGAENEADRLARLARNINPNIELVEREAKVGIRVGGGASPYPDTVYAASNGWDAYVSLSDTPPVGDSTLPFGAGAAACLATANVFRRVFIGDWPNTADRDLVFSTFDLTAAPTSMGSTAIVGRVRAEEGVLVGVGAIGNAVLWALAEAPGEGRLHLVDHEYVELTNLQRYVLAERDDEGAVKVEIGSRSFRTSSLVAVPHALTWAEFASRFGYSWPRALLAVDNAADRRAIQASLPRWIANAWTQPGDLGVSVHPSFTDGGACVACLYLQKQRLKNEDELIAEALGVPDRTPHVRDLLYTGKPPQRPFLELVADRLDAPREALEPFRSRSIRDLYVAGICGGAILPLGAAGAADPNLHVPLAHQSAFAGILLAASFVRSLSDSAFEDTTVARFDLLRPVAEPQPQRAQKHGDGRCICEDPDYRAAYEEKWL